MHATSYSVSALIHLMLLVVLLVGGSVAAFLHRWSVGRRLQKSPTDAPDGSAIISFYTAGHPVVGGTEGRVDGMRYHMYLNMPEATNGLDYTSESSIIYCLDLPFNTQTHLLGLSKNYQLDRLKFESFLQVNGMRKITLEGDFPDYFDLYAATNQDLQVRMVLDPDAMAFVTEYCRDHFWEIHDSELYFAITDGDKDDDNFVRQSAQFARAIKPALLPGMPGAPAVHHDLPYGEYDGPILNCPLCHNPMELRDESWFVCTSGHGALLTGRQLTQLDDKQLHIDADASKTETHNDLTCPKCGSHMTEERYEERPIVINTCPTCTFRWIDADQIVKIEEHKTLDDSEIHTTF